MKDTTETITAKQLESGYWHIRGVGPCNWTQPPEWPALNKDYLRAHAHPEAGEEFLAAAVRLAKRTVGVQLCRTHTTLGSGVLSAPPREDV